MRPLSTAMPNRGGTITFIDRGFGHNYLSGAVNGLLWLSYLATIALYAVAFGSYAAELVPGASSSALATHLLISLSILLPAMANVFSAGVVARTETAVVVIKLALLALIIGAGAAHVQPERLAPDTWTSPLGLITAGFVIFVAYEGFELISNAAEDVRNINILPRAYYLSVGLVILLYVVIAAITVGSVSPETIDQAKDYALAVAAKPSLGQAGFVIVSVAAILATLSAINATIFGNARIGYILATAGNLPAVEGHERKGIPVPGVITITVLSLLMANLLPTMSIAVVSSASFLLVFTMVNIAAWKMSKRIGANRVITIVATLASFTALIVLVVNSATSNLVGLGVFVGFIALAVGAEKLFGRRRGPLQLHHQQ